MVFYLVAEKQTPFLWDLLGLQGPGTAPVDQPKNPRWQSAALRQLVEAQSYWTESKQPLDDAIRIFLAACGRWDMSPRVAGLWLDSIVVSREVDVDVALYDSMFEYASGIPNLMDRLFRLCICSIP